MWTKGALLRATSFLALLLLVIDANALTIPASEGATDLHTTTLMKRHPGGINCEGSHMCRYSAGDAVEVMKNYTSTLTPAQTFEEGVHIACRDSICAFAQHVPAPLRGDEIQELIAKLWDHGCDICGSVPLDALDGGNDLDSGMLTLNYVSHDDDCESLCSPLKPSHTPTRPPSTSSSLPVPSPTSSSPCNTSTNSLSATTSPPRIEVWHTRLESWHTETFGE